MDCKRKLVFFVLDSMDYKLKLVVCFPVSVDYKLKHVVCLPASMDYKLKDVFFSFPVGIYNKLEDVFTPMTWTAVEQLFPLLKQLITNIQ